MKFNMPRLLATIGVFAVMAIVLMNVPAVAALQVEFHGWQAYGMLLLAATAFAVISSTFAGFCTSFVAQDTVVHPLLRVVIRATSYIAFAGLFLLISNLVPSRIEIVNPEGLFWMFGVLGLGTAAIDIIDDRFKSK